MMLDEARKLVLFEDILKDGAWGELTFASGKAKTHYSDKVKDFIQSGQALIAKSQRYVPQIDYSKNLKLKLDPKKADPDELMSALGQIFWYEYRNPGYVLACLQDGILLAILRELGEKIGRLTMFCSAKYLGLPGGEICYCDDITLKQGDIVEINSKKENISLVANIRNVFFVPTEEASQLLEMAGQVEYKVFTGLDLTEKEESMALVTPKRVKLIETLVGDLSIEYKGEHLAFNVMQTSFKRNDNAQELELELSLCGRHIFNDKDVTVYLSYPKNEALIEMITRSLGATNDNWKLFSIGSLNDELEVLWRADKAKEKLAIKLKNTSALTDLCFKVVIKKEHVLLTFNQANKDKNV